MSSKKPINPNNFPQQMQQMIELESRRFSVQEKQLEVNLVQANNEPSLWEHQSNNFKGERRAKAYVVAMLLTFLIILVSLFLFGGGEDILKENIQSVLAFIMGILGGRGLQSRKNKS